MSHCHDHSTPAVAVAPAAVLSTPSSGASGHGSTKPASHQRRSARNVHVTGLPPQVGDDQLGRMFAEFGPIVCAKVMLDVRTAQSKGFGFVLFTTEEAGLAAIGAMNGRTMTIHGQEVTLHCSVSQHDGQSSLAESNTIYVRNVPDNVPPQQLREYFSQFGAVVDLSVRTDYRVQTFVLCAVTFAEVESARRAIHDTHNRFVFGEEASVPVLAKFADTAENKSRKKTKEQGTAAPRQHSRTGSIDGTTGGGMAGREGSGGPTAAPVADMRIMTGVSVGHRAPPAYGETALGIGLRRNSSSFGSFDEESFPVHAYGVSGSGRSTPRSRSDTPVYRHDPYSPEGFVPVEEVPAAAKGHHAASHTTSDATTTA